MPTPHFRVPELMLAAFAMLVPAVITSAQQQPQPQQQVVARIERAYDVSDLYMSGRADDQPDPNPRLLGPDDPIGRPSATRSEMQQGVIKMFRNNVDPRSWEKDHDRATDIVYRDGELIVTQTPANHRKIMSLLRQLRESPVENKLSSKFHDTRLPSRRFDDARLADVFGWIAAETRIKVDVDWHAFQAVGVGPDAPVMLDLTRPLAGRAVRAALAAAAPGRDLPAYDTATPTSITVKLNTQAKPTDNLSSAYDIHLLPARAAGLDPGKSYPRADVVQALVKRVEAATKVTGVRESQGLLIVNGTSPAQTEVRKLLDRLDAEAMEESTRRK
jgi:hypothetical protein